MLTLFFSLLTIVLPDQRTIPHAMAQQPEIPTKNENAKSTKRTMGPKNKKKPSKQALNVRAHGILSS